jgi:hypothetical protein
MDPILFYSLEQQDEFIANLFDFKKGGTFLDISCWQPIVASNSYTLENQFDWSGFCFDLLNAESMFQWSSHRTSKFAQMDASSTELTSYLKNEFPNGAVIDYVSLDVDGLATVKALERVVDAGIRFKAATFEHEYYLYNEKYRDMSRSIMKDLGLVPLFSDIKCHTVNLVSPDKINDTESFEDWFIDPKYFGEDILTIQASDLYYDECVEILKQFKNASYTCRHMSCRAYPDEYSHKLLPQEEPYMKNLFQKYTPRRLQR